MNKLTRVKPAKEEKDVDSQSRMEPSLEEDPNDEQLEKKSFKLAGCK